MSKYQLFKIDTIVADGQTLAFEDSTGILSGAAGFENKTSLSASGDDYTIRTRVPRILKAKLQWGSEADPETFLRMNGVRITMRDAVSKRKCIATNCSFGSLGDIGGGTVEVSFNLLSQLQWL